MKRFLALLLVMIIALSFTSVLFAAGAKEDGDAPVKIGFLVKMPEEPWFQNEWKFAEQAGEKYGFEVVKIGTPDGEKVLSAIDNLAAQGAQGFVITDTVSQSVQLDEAAARQLKEIIERAFPGL